MTAPAMSPFPLVGFWRLLSYEVWDASGQVTHPMGQRPFGFAAFGACGTALIQLAEADPSKTPEAQAAGFMAYGGTFTHSPGGGQIEIQVQASNLPSYVGSVQVRRYSLDGDRLVLGMPGQYRATLVRSGTSGG